MSIVKMKKFTLLTFESNKKKLMKELQGLSKVEFINLQDEEIIEKNNVLQGLTKYTVDSEYEECEDNLSKTKSALEFLEKHSPKKSLIKGLREEKEELTLEKLEEMFKRLDWIKSYERVKEKEGIILDLESKVASLKSEIEILTPWENLNVAFEELNSLKKAVSFLGTIPKAYEESLVAKLEPYYTKLISRKSNEISLLIICHKDNYEEVSEILREAGFSAFKTNYKEDPMKLILEFKHQIEELNSKKFFEIEEVAHLEEDTMKLQLAYEYFNNVKTRLNANKNFLKTKNTLAIQGWIGEEDSKDLIDICSKTLGEYHYLEFEDVKEEEIDVVPIKLKNNRVVAAFESVTSMYSYPKYNEVDPTPLLTPFYLIFFGMMMADAGYGLVMLIGTWAVNKFFNLEKGMKDFMKFFFYLSIPTIFFGLIYGSFFGDFIVLPTQIIDTNKDVTTVLVLSLILGVIQIFCGLAIKAYVLIRLGKVKDAIYDSFSWIITLISVGVLAGAIILKWASIYKTMAIIGMIIGMGMILLTAGRESKSIGAQLGQGAYALYGITGYVGDLVSYTRLMALGLAGGSIAGAMNLLISTLPGIGAILFGPLLFVFAHIFNLGLSLLSAYVHTARLQYVEYFGKFYEGGGKGFKPFSVKTKYIEIKENLGGK